MALVSHRTCLAALVAATALTGCGWLTTTKPRGPLAVFQAPQRGDGGIEIARTRMLPGAQPRSAEVGQVADCYGPGLGVQIETSRGVQTRLFDANGEPCDAATLLFDGSRPTGQRQADPLISIRVHDSFGTILDERLDSPASSARTPMGSLAAIPAITVTESLTEAQADAASGDPLSDILTRWQRHDAVRAVAAESPLEADTRSLNRMVTAAVEQSSGAAAASLAAQLRDRERLLEDERRRHENTLADSAQNRALTQANRDAWQQEQNRLQSELATAQSRAQQFEQLASRLEEQKTRQEAAMGERIATLSGSLQLAEKQAESNRRDLILEAAAKVAEAQALATAARLDTQNDQLAEATRLHAQANALMDEVLLARQDRLEPKAGPAATADLPLTEAPVVLEARERTLPDILTEVLQQAAPHSGAWRAEWQLGKQGQKLLQERWSLTAEATVGEILTQLNLQVQQVHGLRLAFTPFNQTRVLVVTEQGAKQGGVVQATPVGAPASAPASAPATGKR